MPAAATGTDDPRQALRRQLAALDAAQSHLLTLHAGLERAGAERRDLGDVVTVAEQQVREARATQPRRLADAYVHRRNDDAASALADAEQRLQRATAERARIRTIESEIEAEIGRGERAVVVAAGQVRAAMAGVLHPVGMDLLRHLDDTWVRLRSLRGVFDMLHAACGEHFPDDLRRWANSEPLAADRVGYAVDTALLTAWGDALAALAQDPDTALPPVTAPASPATSVAGRGCS